MRREETSKARATVEYKPSEGKSRGRSK